MDGSDEPGGHVAPVCMPLAAIPWQSPETDGTQFAVLEGDERAGTAFSYAFSIPAGTWDPPHWHTADARVVVVAGELRIGYGDRLEQSRAAGCGVGSFLTVPAGAVHFDGADIDTIILGVATGPWSTTYVEPRGPG